MRNRDTAKMGPGGGDVTAHVGTWVRSAGCECHVGTNGPAHRERPLSSTFMVEVDAAGCQFASRPRGSAKLSGGGAVAV